MLGGEDRIQVVYHAENMQFHAKSQEVINFV